MLTEGLEFVNAEPDVVIDFLKSRQLEKIEISPSRLKLVEAGRNLILQIMNGTVKEYPVRRTFLYKLLRWHYFPIYKLRDFSIETIASICNDFLLNISRETIIVKIENKEALSIVSPNYNELLDIDVIEDVIELGISSISRNDFFMSIDTVEKFNITPFPGDDFGISVNVTNSETGFHALTVKNFVLRYVCSNGAYTPIASDDGEKSKYHYGKDDLKDFLSSNIQKALEHRASILEKILRLKNTNNEEDFDNVKNRISKLLGKEGADKFFKEFDTNSTLYDLFNFITERAKNFSLSRRYFIENLAGELLSAKS
jgi:hypothetical protein